MNRRTALGRLISGVCSLQMGRHGIWNAMQTGMERTTEGVTLRKFAAPFYPLMARQTGIEGRVTALANISTDGEITSVADVKGHPLLGSAVSDALKEWHFDPPGKGGAQIEITFLFALRGSRDQRVLSYKVSGTLPSYFEIVVNPFANNP